MTVKVIWDNGKPCQGTRVCAWVNGEGNSDVYTNSEGEAHFPYGPGHGTIYCDGQEVVKDRDLNNYETVVCRETGMFSYKYS